MVVLMIGHAAVLLSGRLPNRGVMQAEPRQIGIQPRGQTPQPPQSCLPLFMFYGLINQHVSTSGMLVLSSGLWIA